MSKWLMRGHFGHLTKVPYIHILLHVLISTTQTSFCSSSTLCINPLQSLILTRTYGLPQCNHWRNGNFKNIAITNLNKLHLYFFETRSKKTNKPPTLLSNSPSYAIMHRPTFHTSIECCCFLSHPLLVVDLFHIIHKQTKFPTQSHNFS